MQPYSQPFFWVKQPVLVVPNTEQYWFNGVDYPGIKRTATPTGGVQFWFNGLPVQAVYK